jgi:hypothetical protein
MTVRVAGAAGVQAARRSRERVRREKVRREKVRREKGECFMGPPISVISVQ